MTSNPTLAYTGRLLRLLSEPSKEMIAAGKSALNDCTESEPDPDGGAPSSYVTLDAPEEIFAAMLKVALQQAEREA